MSPTNKCGKGESCNSGLVDKCEEETLVGEIEKPIDGCYIKARHVLTLMAFFARFNMYSMRNNVSVAIVAMVNYTEEHTNENSSQICKDRGILEAKKLSGGDFSWTTPQQGLVFGCYYYGYMVSNTPGGYLAEKYGIRLVLGIGMLLASIISILSPLAAHTNFAFFVATRILLGILHGVVSPSLHAAWGNWAPPLEVTKMSALSSSGNYAGTLFSMALGGIIAENLGWEAVFYVTGGMALPWSLLWLAIIYDKPADHPRISEKEKRYIEEQTTRNHNEHHLPTPWISIVTSIPMWANIAGQGAFQWGSGILLTMLPIYLSVVLRFNFAASGTLTAVPCAAQFILVIVMGYVSDVIRSRGMASTLAVRKGNSFMCLVIPSISIVIAGYSGCDVVAATACFFVCVSLSACTVTSHEINIVDIAPRHSGLCLGFMNAVTCVPAFLAPQVAGLILNNDQSISQWQKVFWLAAAINVFGFLIFAVFASAEEQRWSSQGVEKSNITLHSETHVGLRDDDNQKNGDVLTATISKGQDRGGKT